MSPNLVASDSSSSESDFETYDTYEEKGTRLFEVAGLQTALQGLCCKECGAGPVVLKEDFSNRQGLCTNWCIHCLCISCVLLE